MQIVPASKEAGCWTMVTSALASVSTRFECRGEMLAGAGLRGNDVLVAADLVRIDLAIMIDVQKREEPFCVLLHLFDGEAAVMVLVRLLKPVRERVVIAARGAERFPHGADEQAPRMVRGGNGRGRGMSRRHRSGQLGKRKE